jgi:hypothetical protein
MAEMNKNRGPWRHRILVGIFTIAFALLIFWLLDFAVDDIGSLPGPSREDVEKGILSADLLSRRETIDRQINDVNRSLGANKERQALLRDSTGRYEETLRQLLDMQRLSAQKGIAFPQSQQQALAESASLFLANQKQDQALYEEILRLSERESQLDEEKQSIQEELDQQGKAVDKELERRERKHDHRIAGLQLLLLIPLLICVGLVISKKRVGIYGPLEAIS